MNIPRTDTEAIGRAIRDMATGGRMSATVHLLTGPAGSGKTAVLLGELLARTRARPGTTLWLAPTRRAAEAVRERLRLKKTHVCNRGIYQIA